MNLVSHFLPTRWHHRALQISLNNKIKTSSQYEYHLGHSVCRCLTLLQWNQEYYGKRYACSPSAPHHDTTCHMVSWNMSLLHDELLRWGVIFQFLRWQAGVRHSVWFGGVFFKSPAPQNGLIMRTVRDQNHACAIPKAHWRKHVLITSPAVIQTSLFWRYSF